MTFLDAVARMEGWLLDTSLCKRNNNPGNIEAGRFADAHGASGANGRFAVFPNAAAGYAAMRALFTAPSYQGLTVAQAIERWAPATENDTARYIALVCQWTNLKPTDSLALALVVNAPMTTQV